MARKLSQIARHGIFFSVTVGAFLAAHWGRAEEQKSANPTLIENPFAAGSPQRTAAPEESQPPRRAGATYHNPFATLSTSPPMESVLLPGPVSRWRRSVAPIDESAPVKSAILSTDLIEPTQIPWGQLPPIENVRDRGPARAPRTDARAATHFAEPPDPVQFGAQPIAQPVWLSVESGAVRSGGNDGIRTTNYEGERRGDSFDNPQLRPAPATANLSPQVVSGYVDSPDEWLSQAQQAAQSAKSVDDLSAVARLCQRGLACRPSAELSTSLRRLGAWAHNRRGELLADAGRDEEAIRDFQMAISLDPHCSLAIHNRAVTLAQQNQLAAALRDFNRVIDLNPGLAVAYRNRGELLAVLGRMNEAVADYSRAIESMPGDADLYAARGYAWQQAGNYDHALTDLDRSIELAPDRSDVLTQRGNMAAERGEFEQALADFQRALKVDPNGAEAYRSLAWLHATCSDERFRDPEQALAEAQQAAKFSSPDNYFVLETLAAAHAAAEQFDDASEIQQQAIAAAPANIASALRQRLALYQQGKPFLSVPASSDIRAASHEAPSARPSPALPSR